MLKTNTFRFFVSALLYRAVLDYSYINFVVQKFSCKGYEYNFHILNYGFSLIICAFLVGVVSKTFVRVSAFFIHVALFGFLFPFYSYAGLSAASIEFQVYMTTSFLLIVLACSLKITFPVVRLNQRYVWAVVSVLVAIVTANFLRPSSLEFMNFDLRNVYEYRSAAGEITNQGIFAYINKWVFKLFGSLLIIYSLFYKRYYTVIFLLSLHFFWFSVSGHKAIIFYPLVTIGIYLFFKDNHEAKILILPLSLSAVILFSMLIYQILDFGFVGSLFINRVFYVPVYLSFVYFDFFKNSGYLFWSYKVELFRDYPYSMAPARVIGSYLGNDETNANNSFFSTGYMNAGFIGMLLYGVIFSFILLVFDKIHRLGVPFWVTAGISVNTVFSVIKSADLITGLITHGLAFTIVILILITPTFRERN